MVLPFSFVRLEQTDIAFTLNCVNYTVNDILSNLTVVLGIGRVSHLTGEIMHSFKSMWML